MTMTRMKTSQGDMIGATTSMCAIVHSMNCLMATITECATALARRVDIMVFGTMLRRTGSLRIVAKIYHAPWCTTVLIRCQGGTMRAGTIAVT
jgi:hypothetical protein